MAFFGDKVSSFVGGIKIERSISDLESKRNALVSSVQNERNLLQGKITAKFTEIGSKAYELSLDGIGAFPDEMFAESFREVTQLKEAIEAKDAKINEISSRYDEEITLLKNLNAAPATVQPEPIVSASDAAPAAGVCTACGAPHAEGDMFCGNCGNKL